jgi:hypothetical protein
MEAKGDKFSAAVRKPCPVCRTSTRQERTDMTMTRRPLALLLTMILVIQFTTARAGFMTFTDETAFQAAVSGAVTDTYNDLVFNNTVSSPLTRTVGSYEYTATATGGFHTVGSPSDKWLSTDSATESIGFSINLGSPTAMGGFFFETDSTGDVAFGEISVSINGGQFQQTVSTSSATNFFGWVSDDNTPITSFEVSMPSITIFDVSTSGASRFATVNDLVFAQAVPEPSTYAMALAVMACGGFSMWRRRRRA